MAEGVANPPTVAVDKSLVTARGPLWHKKDRAAGRVPKRLQGVDRDSTWGYSEHHGWVQGYSYEAAVTATKGSTVFPILASGDTASMKEFTSFEGKIDQLPEDTENVLADTGYDKNDFGDRIEYDQQGRRTPLRFICPPNRRNSKDEGKSGNCRAKSEPSGTRSRRQRRIAFFRSRRGQKLYASRGQTVEPFNQWFKTLFELHERAWHRGLDNNRTQMLAAIFGYQLLIRYNHRCGRENGQIKWILDQL